MINVIFKRSFQFVLVNIIKLRMNADFMAAAAHLIK
jgi:hypothetical protein